MEISSGPVMTVVGGGNGGGGGGGNGSDGYKKAPREFEFVFGCEYLQLDYLNIALHYYSSV